MQRSESPLSPRTSLRPTAIRSIGIAIAAASLFLAFQPVAQAITFACDIGGGCTINAAPGICSFSGGCTCVPIQEAFEAGAAPTSNPCDIE